MRLGRSGGRVKRNSSSRLCSNCCTTAIGGGTRRQSCCPSLLLPDTLNALVTTADGCGWNGRTASFAYSAAGAHPTPSDLPGCAVWQPGGDTQAFAWTNVCVAGGDTNQTEATLYCSPDGCSVGGVSGWKLRLVSTGAGPVGQTNCLLSNSGTIFYLDPTSVVCTPTTFQLTFGGLLVAAPLRLCAGAGTPWTITITP